MRYIEQKKACLVDKNTIFALKFENEKVNKSKK